MICLNSSIDIIFDEVMPTWSGSGHPCLADPWRFYNHCMCHNH